MASLSLLAVEGLARLFVEPPEELLVAERPDSSGDWLEVHGGLVEPVFQGAWAVEAFPLEPAGARLIWIGGSSVRAGLPSLSADQEAAAVTGRLLGVESLNLGAPTLDAADLLEHVDEILALQPDRVVVYTGHNELMRATIAGLYEDPAYQHRIRWQLRLRSSRAYLALSRGLGWALPSGETGMASFEVGPRERAFIEQRFRERLTNLAEALGERAVFVTPVSNAWTPSVALDCPRLYSDLGVELPEMGHEHRPVNLFGLDESALEGLGDHFEGCRDLEYVRARLAYEAGRGEHAVEALDRLRDEDPMPLRSSRQLVEIVREVATGRGLLLVDANAGFRERGGGIERADLFADQVHLSESGHELLAELVAEALR